MPIAMEDLKKKFQKFTKRRSVRYFLPFVTFIIGGSFGLREFTRLKFEYSNIISWRDKVNDAGLKTRKPEEITLERVYEDVEKLDTDNWENKRIERPWEE